ncbi:MAG: helix-turn-helix domain-containing protein [Sulfuricaulis sp.]|nr:helix-turn-helix domain-containing protein [Sulfuricaulis sp.]
MDKTLTVKQAARAGRCSVGTVSKLCREGKLKATKINGDWRIAHTREEVAAIVEKIAPHHGYKKRGNGRTSKRGKMVIAPLLQWLSLDSATRTTLLQLANKFSASDLKLLMTL